VNVLTRDPVYDGRFSKEDYAGSRTDGDDYVEGNGGDDAIWGGLGQDDLVGGSSSMFGLTDGSVRLNGIDAIYGGAGHRIGLMEPGDLAANGHARDADAILGDNGNLYRIVGAFGSPFVDALGGFKPPTWFLAFVYDNYSSERVVPRAWSLLDYSWRVTAPSDRGQADLVHGEAGDDLILGEIGDDVLFGDGQDDTIIGGTGNDRIYGGTGEDSILGDDGYFRTSRNGLVEPLWASRRRTPRPRSPCATSATVASVFPRGSLFHEARLFAYPLETDAGGFADIIWGGVGNDWIHGNEGDDAISGAEALQFYYSDMPQTQILASWGVDPLDPLGYDAASRSFADFNADDPRSKVFDCTDGTKDVGIDGVCLGGGQRVDFLLNFTPYVLSWPGIPVLDANGQAIKSDDGCDVVFGDLGNDWLVGGTNTNWLFGGLGDDLLQTSQFLDADGYHNQHPEPPAWADPVFAYGGAGRDVLIAATGRARLFDWTGDKRPVRRAVRLGRRTGGQPLLHAGHRGVHPRARPRRRRGPVERDAVRRDRADPAGWSALRGAAGQHRDPADQHHRGSADGLPSASWTSAVPVPPVPARRRPRPCRASASRYRSHASASPSHACASPSRASASPSRACSSRSPTTASSSSCARRPRPSRARR
jgi:Ca2+-binding RTX toxin-like protein